MHSGQMPEAQLHASPWTASFSFPMLSACSSIMGHHQEGGYNFAKHSVATPDRFSGYCESGMALCAQCFMQAEYKTGAWWRLWGCAHGADARGLVGWVVLEFQKKHGCLTFNAGFPDGSHPSSTSRN